MNERIQELIKQSMVEHQFEIRFSPEKFAELFVRECIELNRQELSFSAFARMLDKYNEHFGVEL